VLTKNSYFALVLIAAAVGIGGFLFLEPPQPENIAIALLETFYKGQALWAVAIGLFVGGILGFTAPNRIFHEPRDRARDFDGRVISRGLWSGIWAILASTVVMILASIVTSIPPLAPLEKVRLTVFSGRAAAVFGIAFAIALVVYGVVIRTRSWGGQYTLIKRRA
jgi:hypothetical protein